MSARVALSLIAFFLCIQLAVAVGQIVGVLPLHSATTECTP